MKRQIHISVEECLSVDGWIVELKHLIDSNSAAQIVPDDTIIVARRKNEPERTGLTSLGDSFAKVGL